jgi:hypothetical protein
MKRFGRNVKKKSPTMTMDGKQRENNSKSRII